MLDDQRINPYAPTIATDGQNRQTALDVGRHDRATTAEVIATTMLGNSASGAIFGGGWMTAAVFFNLDLDSLPLIPLGLGVGGVYASLVAIPVIAVMYCLSLAIHPVGLRWPAAYADRFAMICGFFTGFLSIGVLAPFDSERIIFAFVPAVFGMLGTSFAMRRLLVRRQPRDKTEPLGTLPNPPART